MPDAGATLDTAPQGQAGRGGRNPKKHPQLSLNALHRTGKGTSQPPSPIPTRGGFRARGKPIGLGNALIFTSPRRGKGSDKGTFALGCEQTLEPAADVGMTHRTATQLDDSISTVTSMLCLHHPLK